MDVAVNTSAAALSPIALFIQADWVVRLVMIGLLVASLWSWHVIVSTYRALKRVQGDASPGNAAMPAGRIHAVGLAEMERGRDDAEFDLAGRRDRMATALNSAVTREVDRLGERLNVLATIGSVSPFVGLFGTVWGIMRAFTGIAAAQNTSLAVVAPGIAEALFATAIGLFAAIPAVIAYNRLGHMLNRIEAHLGRYGEELHGMFSRQMVKGD